MLRNAEDSDENVIKTAKKREVTLLKRAITFAAAILGVTALHFSAFVAYFSFGFSVLLDVSSTANFIFSSFFFYAFFELIVRMTWILLFGVFSSRERHDSFLSFVSTALFSNTKNGIFRYLLSLILFSFFYVGSWNFLLFSVFLSTVVLILAIIGGISRIATRTIDKRPFTLQNLIFSNYEKAYATVLLCALVLGGLRADYISSSPSHRLSTGNLLCGEEGTIILSNSVGFYFFDTMNRETCFISWESGVTVNARSDAYNRFFIFDYLQQISD